MRTFIDFDDAVIFAVPSGDDGAMREGMLIEGPQGWGEFSPPLDADDDARWLTSAMEGGTVGWPDPMRGRVPVSVSVPNVDAERAYALVAQADCATADVAVGSSLVDDIARLAAVRDALGPTGAIRCQAFGRWDPDAAITAIKELDRAAGGLDYVQQPCSTVDELAALRSRVGVLIAAGPQHRDAADVVVLDYESLGGVRRSLRVAEKSERPCVASSSSLTTVGLAGGLALAGALSELPFACALDIRPLLSADLVGSGRSLRAVGGYLPVAPMPPAPDPARIDQFRVTDPARVTWWRERLEKAQGAS